MRALIRLAVPVAVSNLGLMLMGLMDLMAVGRLGPEAVAAVGLGVSISAWGLTIGIGMLGGLDFLASSSLGAGRPERARAAFQQAWRGVFWLGTPAIGLFIGTGWVLDAVGIPAEVAEATRQFLVPISLSVLPAWWFQVARQMLQAHHRTQPVVVSLVAGNLVNALGNIFFVAGILGFTSYGVVASAWVTFVARVLMAGMTLVALYRLDPLVWQKQPAVSDVELRDIRQTLLRMGVPGGAQMGLEVGVFSLSTILATRLGILEGAAHQIVLNLVSVTFMVPLGIGQAGAVMVGNAVGARDRVRAALQGASALKLSLGFMAVTSLVFVLWPRLFLVFYTADESVIALGVRILAVAGAFQLLDGLQVTMTGILRGLGNTHDSAIANGIGHWLIGLPLALYLAQTDGLVGIWIGLAVGLGVVGFSLFIRWRVALRRLSF